MTSRPKPPSNDRAGGRSLLRVSEVGADGVPGRSITFAWENVRPLGYIELAEAKLHKKLTIPLELRGSRIIETSVDDLDATKSYTARTTLESTFTSRAIGLVKGGWLPSALAASLPGTIMLVDRNVVSEIIRRFDGGKKVGVEPDFLDLFADTPVRINPLLFAMEGNARGIPAPDLVREQLEEAVTKLRTALPSARLIVGPASLVGALGLIEESRRGLEQRQRFLLRAAPMLAAPVGSKDMRARWSEVIAAADDCGVSRGSLVVLAALSSVVIPNGRSPAKKLLKLKHGYSEADAYNALADLRAIELLVHLFALFPNMPTLLCTADRALALFWTGIGASNFARSGTGVSFDLSPVEQLLPKSRADEWRSCIDRCAG